MNYSIYYFPVRRANSTKIIKFFVFLFQVFNNVFEIKKLRLPSFFCQLNTPLLMLTDNRIIHIVSIRPNVNQQIGQIKFCKVTFWKLKTFFQSKCNVNKQNLKKIFLCLLLLYTTNDNNS